MSPELLAVPPCLRERHWTVPELAVAWNVSDDTVRNRFKNEPGVIKIISQKPGRRRKITLRIPESVVLRVYRRFQVE